MQHLVKHLQHITVAVAEYQKKRDFLYGNLVDMGYSIVKPQGAFYMFPKSPVKDEIVFIEELRKYHVLVVPGRGFGTPGYFRISYCVEDKTLKGSLDGFKKAAEEFHLIKKS
jgi:aspartate aminotransferase